jgi:outer membrane protein
MRQLKNWALAGAAVCGLSAPASADTLGQAIADAYRNNPRLEAQRAQLRATDEQVIQAASPYRLNANVVAQLDYSSVQRRNFSDDFVTLRERSLSATISASQIISNGGRTAAQVSVAEASVLSGREQLRQAENEILLEVVDSYVSVRRDQEIVGIQERSVQSYERWVEQAIARERGGDLTRTDIAQAQAQLEIVRTQLAAGRARLQQSRARFASVVGRDPGVLDPEPQLPGVPLSLDYAYRLVETESPILWQAILNERAAAAQVSRERAERNPVLGVSGNVGIGNPAGLSSRNLGRVVSGLATLTVPLLTAGVVDSRVRAAIAIRQQQQFLIEATRRDINVQVQSAWNRSLTARDQLVAGESGVRAAEQAIIGVRRGFQEGFRSNFEVLDSEQRLLNAQVIVATARYDRYAGQAVLLAFLGRLEAAAIDQAVAVYDAEENVARRRARQFGPFQVITKPIDELQVPSSRIRRAPEVAPAPNPVVAPATAPAPEGALGSSLPTGPTRPVTLPDRDSPPPPAWTAPISDTNLRASVAAPPR